MTLPTQPAIYLPHGGGPWPFLDDPTGNYSPVRRYLEDLPASLPQVPDAILTVTAHWEAREFTVTSGARPGLIYDYGGFPPHTYEITYPAPGAPHVAQRIAELAGAAGIPTVLDGDAGWDHGVFVPLSVSWPEAEVPVVALSLKQGLDPADHLALGRTLEALRSENVVIIGSGMSVHDLTFRTSPQQAAEFDQWLEDSMQQSATERTQRLIDWKLGPHATSAHPREEHLMPLMTVVGAAGSSRATRSHRNVMFGLPVAAYTFG